MSFIYKSLKTHVLHACVAAVALTLAACGYNSSNNTTTNVKTSGIKKRVLISNQQAGSVTIIDAQKDQLSTKAFGVAGASTLVTASGQTVVMPMGSTNIQVIDNATEQSTVSLTLRDQPFDVAISAADGKTAYAAMRNIGEIAVFNTTNGNLFSITGIQTVSRLVEGPNEKRLLAFSDNPVGGNTFYVIDTSTNIPTAISGSQLDQPFTAVFDTTDTGDNTAFILNCGPECGGTTASVVRVNFANPAAPVFGVPIPVAAATVGVLSGTNLFIAGSPSAGANGTVQTINTGTSAVSAATTITNGRHLKMVVAGNNRLYIGASGCTATKDSATGLTKGCLSILNTSSGAVVIPEVTSIRQNFDVTGIQPISGRTVVYVCLGGELDIFDTTSDIEIQPNPPIDIVGKAVDVVLIDP
jgi:hypothetical protein